MWYVLFLLLLIPAPAPAGEFLLTWQDRADNERGFELERKLESEVEFSIRALLDVDIERYLDDAVPLNTQVRYRVRAWNMCCKPQPCEPARCVSDWSNEVSGMLTGETTPGTPPDTLLTLSCTRSEELEPISQYELFVSASPDRANSVVLKGATLSGEVYIFVAPETDIDQVRFWLDHTRRTPPARQTESLASYDFNGSVGGIGTDALPFDTTTIADGSHTISAEIDAGADTWVIEQAFNIQN